MAISEKTRKIFGARSGNRCAFCRIELVQGESSQISVVGDECHIVARSLDGPRGAPELSEEELDSYSNLLLLCKVHHKIIDDQPEIYTVNVLKKMKNHHELWVKEKLKRVEKEADLLKFAARLTTGKNVFDIISGAELFDFDHDELTNGEEVDIISSFLQDLQDYGDLGDTFESGERVRVIFTLSQEIKELEDAGFWVFGTQEKRRYKIGETISNWKVAVIRVLRDNNPLITKVERKEQFENG